MISDLAEASADADKTCTPAFAAQNTISAPTSAANSFSGVLASTACTSTPNLFLMSLALAWTRSGPSWPARVTSAPSRAAMTPEA